METVKKLTLFWNLLALDDSRRETLGEYFDRQSELGLQLVKPGFFQCVFTRDDTVRYRYRLLAATDSEFAYYSGAPEWEYISGFRMLHIFRQTIRLETERIEHIFYEEDYKEEESWLNAQGKTGFFLCKAESGRYLFEKTVPGTEVRYQVDFRRKVRNMTEYIQQKQTSGWRYICSDGSRHYFSDRAVPAAAGNSFTEEELIEKRKHSYKVSIFVCLILFALLNLLLGFVLHGFDNMDRELYAIFIIGGIIWNCVVIGCIVKFLQKLR